MLTRSAPKHADKVNYLADSLLLAWKANSCEVISKAFVDGIEPYQRNTQCATQHLIQPVVEEKNLQIIFCRFQLYLKTCGCLALCAELANPALRELQLALTNIGANAGLAENEGTIFLSPWSSS